MYCMTPSAPTCKPAVCIVGDVHVDLLELPPPLDPTDCRYCMDSKPAAGSASGGDVVTPRASTSALPPPRPQYYLLSNQPIGFPTILEQCMPSLEDVHGFQSVTTFIKTIAFGHVFGLQI